MSLEWQNVLIYGLSGLALLVILWPTVKVGQRFLRRWGVSDPTEQQGLLARRYLLHRRLLYPPLFLAAPLITFGDTNPLPTLITALLLGEIIAMLRPSRGPRTATLTRRTWSDLVPRWALVAMLVLAGFAALLAVAAGLAKQWGMGLLDKYPPDGFWRTNGDIVASVADVHRMLDNSAWLVVLVSVVLVTAVVLGIVWLAVYRGSGTDPSVDAALRTRTARVAVGIGIAWMSVNVQQANNKLINIRDIRWPEPAPSWLTGTGWLESITVPMLIIGIAGWICVANPDSRMPYVQTARPTA
ncbi:hypothetical protein [Kibdelosporangium phytohabitans]|uniref:Uncharacterized protein n=1 Tax=Kibdelosporangium phytohabitans TaxID=860235 RepID=A0A0N9I5V0_9PSEU|nr:hypothetical protein [Kibdelosporangium phytohabitans]ALG11306.1 hypothetical protein AOZ06_34480 [Kibdelosporangium phytohabitans]MBE1462607.1 hypothetical protein [Kibdelosporangium phytohabitans]